MTTLTLYLSTTRAPSTADTPMASGSSGLATPLVLVIIVVAVIGLAALGAVFRSTAAAFSALTQPTMAVFRMLIAALIVIVLLVAVLVSRPADANRAPAPAPTSTHSHTAK